MAEAASETLKRTALYDLHVELGAKIAPFAGYEMPVQYPGGVMAEHNWTREHAGLFDVSHMGPCFFGLAEGAGDADAHERIAAIVERVVPSDIKGLKPGQARLTVLLSEDGGILDDLIITRPENPENDGWLYIVVNGAVKEADFDLLAEVGGDEADLHRADDSVLFALQGPDAEAALAVQFPGCEALSFMRAQQMMWRGEHRCTVTRCGYTGEDGFEVFADTAVGPQIVEALLADARVKPIGLGARDSLRLEAGLCLYGHDMDASRDPVEADLAWVIQKTRRARADFPGATRILAALENGPVEKRVGVQPLDRAPAREGTEIQVNGERVGAITSGGFGPTHGRPVAMGYVRADLAAPGAKLDLIIRGKARPAEVCALPFVAHRYKR